ncbi:YopX family protein [Aneurinibacillus aneurinilyticus]|uniref:YopX protein domain-containing protein n=1 Tax=Aneurinibacillus aneurinilyticus ATCC 12856 TaxID=649747 RepID=U1YFJ5_ANEAE|nr:YopX family protein [Aneurinibacillus aneurinilyticus]ERI10852.1 phage hypothetical protein [Aneurinibacillus aneurinilyticus ATCC 12856]MED0704914.1 YopX family protein [Aneurinibacillus aneurinilyticus]MED0724044.1 YopX family protein [Aneurinibacillus aneurinilyticus]MED0731959.1 YopX family protein [Aneurinibacillus aneurinilyticus]MED0741511.1 YopX family protein [Aneurinibacillus aneurinilyticus]
MREIKFRAWDKNLERLYNPDYVQEYFHEIVSDNKRFTLLQYTGLKDKNGKDIFEGDILEYKKLSFHEDGVERGHVWYNEYAEWSVNNWLLNRIYRRAEVIGNIFEHPELLEEQHV